MTLMGCAVLSALALVILIGLSPAPLPLAAASADQASAAATPDVDAVVPAARASLASVPRLSPHLAPLAAAVAVYSLSAAGRAAAWRRAPGPALPRPGRRRALTRVYRH